MISEASDRLQVALEACLDGDILTSFEGFCTTGHTYVQGGHTYVQVGHTYVQVGHTFVRSNNASTVNNQANEMDY